MRLRSHMIEVIKGIDTVKSLAQEDEFIDRGKDYFAQYEFFYRRSVLTSDWNFWLNF